MAKEEVKRKTTKKEPQRKMGKEAVAAGPLWLPVIMKMFPGEFGQKALSACQCKCGCSCASCSCKQGACPCDDSTPAYSTYWGDEQHVNFHANEKGTTQVAEGVGSKVWEYFGG